MKMSDVKEKINLQYPEHTFGHYDLLDISAEHDVEVNEKNLYRNALVDLRDKAEEALNNPLSNERAALNLLKNRAIKALNKEE